MKFRLSGASDEQQFQGENKAMDYTSFLGDSFNFDNNELNLDSLSQKIKEEKDKVNIILMGATGSGKSELINAVFGSKVVESGNGEPITQHLEKIVIENKGVTLWDTKGIEAADYDKTISQLNEDISSHIDNAEDINQFPHIAWICISSESSRLETRDKQLIGIAKNFEIPLVVVFTNYWRNDDEDKNEKIKIFQDILNREYNDFIDGSYVLVNSREKKFSSEVFPINGLDELLDKSYKLMPAGKDGAIKALKKAQRVKNNERLIEIESSCSNMVHMAAIAAGTAGASPITGSDAPIIAAIQSTLIYKINSEFELDESRSYTTSVITGILGVTGLAQVGRAIVTNVLKIFPGPGSLVGGAISAATAAALTEAIGLAYIKALKTYYNQETGEVELPENIDVLLDLIKKYLKAKYS